MEMNKNKYQKKNLKKWWKQKNYTFLISGYMIQIIGYFFCLNFPGI